jgi:hypothetical protein
MTQPPAPPAPPAAPFSRPRCGAYTRRGGFCRVRVRTLGGKCRAHDPGPPGAAQAASHVAGALRALSRAVTRGRITPEALAAQLRELAAHADDFRGLAETFPVQPPAERRGRRGRWR